MHALHTLTCLSRTVFLIFLSISPKFNFSGLVLLDESDSTRLAAALCTNRTLTSLKFNSGQLTDQWAAAVLAPALRRNSTLQALELSFNKFTSALTPCTFLLYFAIVFLIDIIIFFFFFSFRILY